MEAAFKVFNEARLLGEHTDLTLRADGIDMEVHRVIVCSSSPYFRDLFSTYWDTAAKNVYEFKGMFWDVLYSIVEYIYTGKALINKENVKDILVAADKFLLWGLVDICCRFLEAQLCPENCIGIYMFTEVYYSCMTFHRKAKLYVLQHFEEVLQVSDEYLELSLEQLEEIIDDDQLNVKQEQVVFEVIINWIHYDLENRRKHIAALLPKVRMGLMASEYFMCKVKANALVMENEACTSFINNAMKAMFDLDGQSPSDVPNQLARSRLPLSILLAIGGWNITQPTNAIEVYNSRMDRWVRVGVEDTSPRAYLGTVVLNEFVYCIGGYDNGAYFNTIRKLNLITQTWHEVSNMNECRCYVSVAVLDRLIYAIGGFDGHRRLKSAERYNPTTNQWTPIASMMEKRSDASATSLQGRLYICGGFNGTDYLFTAECFDPMTNQWTLIDPMKSRRSGLGVISHRNQVYAVGGFDGLNRLQSVEKYDPLTNIWTEASYMTHPRSNFGIEVMDDQLFVVGGYDGDGTISYVERCDLLTAEWYVAHEMAVSRSALSCCVASGLPNIKQYAFNQETVEMTDMTLSK